MNDAKQSTLNIIEDIEKKAPNGVLSVEEFTQFDKDINRLLRQTRGDATKRGYLKQLKKVHAQGGNEYAKQNPSWGEKYQEAKQAYQGIANSLDVQDFVRKNFNLKNLSHAGILLGLEEAAIPGRTALKLGGLGATAATMYMAEIARRVATNPALRRYYQNVIKASLSNNKAMLVRNLEGLDRVAKKEFEKNPLPEYSFDEEFIENE